MTVRNHMDFTTLSLHCLFRTMRKMGA